MLVLAALCATVLAIVPPSPANPDSCLVCVSTVAQWSDAGCTPVEPAATTFKTTRFPDDGPAVPDDQAPFLGSEAGCVEVVLLPKQTVLIEATAWAGPAKVPLEALCRLRWKRELIETEVPWR